MPDKTPSRHNVPSLPSAEDITRVELPNGIVVLSRTNPVSPSVNIGGFLRAGSLFDPDDKLGLADFTSLGLMRGTEQRSMQQLFEDLESSGASFGYHSGTHTTGFGGKALAEDLDLLLGALTETLFQPVFSDVEIERLRAMLLTHLAISAQDTGDMASLAFDKIVYAGHPYERQEDGTPATIQAIRREDLVEFHRRHYGPRGMVIAVVGGIEPAAAVEKVAAALGGWTNPEQQEMTALPPVNPLQATVRKKVDMPGKAQSDLLIGTAGPARNDPEYLAASLGNNILGQFGMYGRIGDVVREEHGLAYFAYSSLSGGLGPGPWYVSAGTAPADVTKTIELILSEIDRFRREPVSQDELADSQANFIGRVPLSLETNGGVASGLLKLERYQLGLDYYLRYPGLVRAVTPEKILATARRFLDPQRMGIAVAGPPDGVPPVGGTPVEAI